MDAGNLDRLVGVRDQAHMAGHGGHAGFRRQLLRGDLVAHRLDRADRRADKGHAHFFQCLGKSGIFRQEAIARMHRIGTGLPDRIEDLVDDDIGLAGRRRADMNGLVGHLDMQRIAIRIGIDGDCLDAHLSGCLDDPAGNFASVGDEDFLDHGWLTLLIPRFS